MPKKGYEKEADYADIFFGLEGIAIAVIKSAREDLKSRSEKRKKEARAFLKSDWFDKWCGVLRVDSDWIRKKILTL